MGSLKLEALDTIKGLKVRSVAMVDPFGYTMPYDTVLASALSGEGLDITLLSSQAEAAVASQGFWSIRSGFVHPTQRTWVHELSWRAGYGLLAAWYVPTWLKFLRQLKLIRPDVIHFQWMPFPVIDARMVRLAARIAPVVLTAHDVMPSNGSIIPREARAWRDIMSVVDGVIVHTRAGVEQLVSFGVDRAKISRIAHGRLGLAETPARSPVRRADPEGRFRVLQFGYLQKYKGVDVLVRAVSLMPPAVRARSRFIVAGQPMMNLSEIRDLIRDCGVEQAFDLRPKYYSDEEMALLMHEADAFVFPYRQVQSSGVFSLALNLDRPIVASAVGCFREVVVPGKHGLLVPPGDPAALAQALTTLVENEALGQAMGQNLNMLGETVPGWDVIARQTANLYDRVTEARGAKQR